MSRIDRFIGLALEVAKTRAIHKNQFHGAILARGNRIINIGWNEDRYFAFSNRFCTQQGVHKLMHAEASAISGVVDCVGADIYVARYKLGGAKLSKPCYVCESLLRHLKIRRVFYTTDTDKIEVMKL